MKTALGNLLRHLADLADRGECGVDAEAFAEIAEIQRQQKQDHKSIGLLTEAVTLMMEEQNRQMGIPNPKKITGKIIQLKPKDGKKD